MYRSIKLEFNVENLNNLATIWLTYLGHEKDGSREESEVVFFLESYCKNSKKLVTMDSSLDLK